MIPNPPDPSIASLSLESIETELKAIERQLGSGSPDPVKLLTRSFDLQREVRRRISIGEGPQAEIIPFPNP